MENFSHLTLRGNYQQTICYDHVDYINVWNRIILSAYDSDVKILSLELLGNHFHCVASYMTDNLIAFKRHLRMSLTHYYNKRYKMKGSLGARKMIEVHITDPEADGGKDLKDAICYNLRNCLRHGVFADIWKYRWSTIRVPFSVIDTTRFYSMDNLPKELSIKYFPCRKKALPSTFMVSSEGLLHPAPVMDLERLTLLFRNRDNYISELAYKTQREIRYEEESQNEGAHSSKVPRNTTSDDVIINHINKLLQQACLEKRDSPHSIMQMTLEEKKEYIIKSALAFPEAYTSQLSRIFGIPESTIRRWRRGRD